MKKISKILLAFLFLFFITGCNKEAVVEPSEPEEVKKVTIINTESDSRPYAVVVNNSNVAVKVQTGLNQAYMIYEIPVEGYLTRLLAFYKDADDLTIGTIRSVRHNFYDYAFEQDAILVCYGWSHYAKDDANKTKIDYINGLFDNAFWRDNPEGLATEHTAYTSISKITANAEKQGYNLTTDKGLLMAYDVNPINLNGKTDSLVADHIVIPAGGETSEFSYDETSGTYLRYVNGKANIDYYTKEQFYAKNIIVQKISTWVASDGYYWELGTVDSGTGYFITNGYAVPINWSKASRTDKTIYTYEDGTPLVLNDGITYIELQSTSRTLTIE